MHLRRPVLVISGVVLAFAVVLSAAWLVRARIAGQFAEYYFRQHGVNATIDVQSFGLWSVSARFALGPGAAPDLAADQIQLIFDPLRWTPYLTEVRLVRPVVRARLGQDGSVTLGSLQGWIDSLGQQSGPSPYVSNDLTVSLNGLRAYLTTPAGVLDIDGDVKLFRNKPVYARLHAEPGAISWQGISVAFRAARLAYDGTNLALAFSGDVGAKAFSAKKIEAAAEVQELRWSRQGLSAASLHLKARAPELKAGARFAQSSIDIAARNPSLMGTHASADISLAASADPVFDINWTDIRDRGLRLALMRDLAHLRLDGSAHLERDADTISMRSGGPLSVAGANGLTFRVPAFFVSQSPRGFDSAFDAALQGGGMPVVHVATSHLTWIDGGLGGAVTLDARFNYLMLRDAALAARGDVSWRDGHYAFTPASCARLSLGAFRPGQSDLAKNVRGTLCPAGKPLLFGHGSQWKLSGMARGVSAFLPLANTQIDGAAARADFNGDGGIFQGRAAILAATVSDHASHPRFNPLQASGSVTVTSGKWRGQLKVAGSRKSQLGTVSFRHDMASGAGSAHIDAPHLVFAQKGLQPADLSALLAQLRQADGTARFQGDVGWSGSKISSSGTLSVGNMDFLMPLGRAHGLKTTLAFSSLAPFKTLDNQHVTISRIDWTLPFSGVDLRLSFDTQAARIAALSADWAEGQVALDPFTIDLAAPSNISGTAKLSSVALASLISASNLESKIQLVGKVSGIIPFAANAQDIRITNGRIAADGPGRLSVNRSLWVQEGAATASSAVQDFAYQALEHLAFDQMTANLNSIANGRLQIVFHVKGRSDPPKPQVAEIAIPDLLNGTALQKPIPLPSGTPIELTLDTSLNFDELLKSYAEAWSKSLSPAGDRTKGPGAKP